MFFRPTSRLLGVKFLGLFGSTQLDNNDAEGENKQTKSNNVARLLPNNVINNNNNGDDNNNQTLNNDLVTKAVDLSSKKVVSLLLEKGIPGLTICVSKGGQVVWKSSFGYCDVENQVECEPDARMRIASISKSLFAATIVGPLIDKNLIDLKASIHQYLSEQEFPKQTHAGKEFDITIEQLLAHTSGIRSYGDEKKDKPLRPIGSKGSRKIYQCDDQYNRREFYTRQTYRNVIDALEPFKNGPLVDEPGKYNYTTYGYVLLSAVIERILQKQRAKQEGNAVASNEQIEDFWIKVLRRDWSMDETSLDQDEPILPKRARYYMRTGSNGSLINAPYTDMSVKWAGGGLISTAGDLVKFGNKLIDSYKCKENARLKRDTVQLLWKKTSEHYGLGFEIHSLDRRGEKVAINHLGGAVGGSSALIIYPETEVVVAILTNMGDINLRQLGLDVADQFVKCQV